jgi:signal peptidase
MAKKATLFLLWLSVVSLIVSAFILISERFPDLVVWRFVATADKTMQPTLKQGSLVVTHKVHPDTLDRNLLVSFVQPDQSNRLTVHRIERILHDNDERLIVTKADANAGVDTWLLTDDRIKGQYLFQIPLAGYWFQFLQSPPGTIGFVIVPALLIIGFELYRLINTIHATQLSPSSA